MVKYELNVIQLDKLELRIMDLKSKIVNLEKEIERLDKQLPTVNKKFYANKLESKKRYQKDLLELNDKLTNLLDIKKKGYIEL